MKNPCHAACAKHPPRMRGVLTVLKVCSQSGSRNGSGCNPQVDLFGSELLFCTVGYLTKRQGLQSAPKGFARLSQSGDLCFADPIQRRNYPQRDVPPSLRTSARLLAALRI